MRRISFFFSLILITLLTGQYAEGKWKKLAGKDLNAWTQINGTATFILEKGIVTGTTVLNSPNSFLCTKEKYGDFILEFDTWIDPQLNSGVQFRSESLAEYQNGRVHGYQVEIDPSERAWSGGIYDEARRGWMYTLDNNPKGRKDFRPGEWNHYRLEAIGNSIRTWVNGIPCADVVDYLTPSGFIDNTLTEREKKEDWRLLFEGTTSKGDFPGIGMGNTRRHSFSEPGNKSPGWRRRYRQH